MTLVGGGVGVHRLSKTDALIGGVEDAIETLATQRT